MKLTLYHPNLISYLKLLTLHFQYLPRPNLPGVNADMEEYVLRNFRGQPEEDLDRIREVRVTLIPI
jgi:hypothetical protein